MRINSFFTTTVIDNGPIEALANRVLFAPLHYLLNDGSVHQVEVDLRRNRVRELFQAPTHVRYLATRIGLYMLALGLVVPATLLGAILKGLAQLHPTIAAKNDKASRWHPLQREIFHQALVSAPRDKRFLDPMANELTHFSALTFLNVADLSRVSQVSKTWYRFANNDAVWMRMSKSHFYFFSKKSNFEESFKQAVERNYVYIKENFHPQLINIFGSIDNILKLPIEERSVNGLFPDLSGEAITKSMFTVEPAIRIRLIHRNYVKLSHKPQAEEENVLKLVQCYDRSEHKISDRFVLLNGQGVHVEFITDPTAYQWLKDLIEGKICGSLPKMVAEDASFYNSTYRLANVLQN